MRNVLYLMAVSSLACSFALSEQSYQAQIAQMGRYLDSKAMCPATAGNISMRIGDDLFAITASGKHKGYLTEGDVVIIDSNVKALNPSQKPSAEAAIHLAVYKALANVSFVVHHHSVNSVVVSQLFDNASEIVTTGYEIHKVFQGITTHDSSVIIPIFDNSQDVISMAKEVQDYLQSHSNIYGFMIRGHGFYAWGKDAKEAYNRIEAFDYLLECEWRKNIASKGVLR